MITLISGVPGTGKTAFVVNQIQERWAGKRSLFVAGINGLLIEHTSIADPTKWHLEVPTDSILIVDECQRIWRRDRSSKISPDIQAMETHRHEGIDMYLISQNPKLIHENVQALIGRHIHLRDVGVLGRWMYEWPECNNVNNYRSAPVRKRYKLPKKIFHLYKSAEVHTKNVRSVPPALYVGVAAVAICGFLGWRAYGSIQARMGGGVAPAVAAAASSPASAASRPLLTPGPAVPGTPAPVVMVEAPAAPVIVGCITMAKRCECIDQTGKSVEVALQLCLDNASRTGLAIPYAVAARSTAHGPLSALPLP